MAGTFTRATAYRWEEHATFDLTVFGCARPQGSKVAQLIGWRPGQRTRPKLILREAGKRIKGWRDQVARDAVRAWEGMRPLGGPLLLDVRFYFLRPKSHYTTTGRLTSAAPEHCTSHAIGDLSKLVRAVEDSLESAGVMADDSQIVETLASKTYVEAHEDDSAWIRLFQLAPERLL